MRLKHTASFSGFEKSLLDMEFGHIPNNRVAINKKIAEHKNLFIRTYLKQLLIIIAVR